MQIAVAVIIRDASDRVLLLKRGIRARTQHGKWENAGGAVEPGESGEQAAIREVKEELGVHVQLEGVALDYVPDTKNTEVVWRTVVFYGTVTGNPRVMEPGVCDEVRWFNRAELRGLELTTYAREDFERLGWIISKKV